VPHTSNFDLPAKSTGNTTPEAAGLQAQAFRRALLAAVSLLAISATAAAQPAQVQVPPSSPKNPGISDIVVTATRQSQRIMKVPVSLTALSEKTMDQRGIKTIADIARDTPGVQFDENGFANQSNIAIRGISSTVGSGTTGIYIDDTPVQSRSVGYTSANTYPLVFDLSDVEVLRGPQGTLFGAGSEGGTVRFITPAPSLDTYSAYVRAEGSVSERGDPNAEGGFAFGGPIVNNVLGFRASFWDRHDGGWIDRINQNPADTPGFDEKNTNTVDTQVARIAFLLQPVEDLRINLSYFYQNHHLGDTDTYWEGASQPGAQKFVNGSQIAQPGNDRFNLPALNIKYEWNGIDFISDSSIFERRETAVADYSNLLPGIFDGTEYAPGNPGFTATTNAENTQLVYTEELRAQSANPDSKLNWVTGLFLSEARQRSYETVVAPQFDQLFGGIPLQYIFGQGLARGQDALLGTAAGVDTQIAGFGQLDYHILPGLALTAGVRVAQTTFKGSSYYTGPFSGTQLQSPGSVTENPVTPKFGISYQIDANNLVYASAAKGYRIGGVNAPASAAACQGDLHADGYNDGVPPAYQSDSLWSYELGLKSRLLDKRLQIQASGFHVDWRNIQQLVYLESCGAEFVANLGVATSNGFDLQVTARPIDDLVLEADTSFTDAQISKNVAGGGPLNIVSAGDQLESHPWTLSLSGTYTHDFDSGYQGYFHTEWQYKSQGGQIPQTDASTTQYDPELTRLGLTNFVSMRAGVRHGRYDVSLFVDNLTNAHPALVRIDEITNGPIVNDATYRPLTVGITALYRY
jgi:outer membrane receptor protein involved in Fe transport